MHPLHKGRSRARMALCGMLALLVANGAPAVLAAHTSGGDPTPVQADDNCQICFALSHHGAAPVDFLGAPVPSPIPLRLPAIETVWAPLPSYILFRSRAPPRA